MGVVSVDVDDRDVQRSLRRMLGADGRKALRQANKAAAEIVVEAVPSQTLTRQQRRMLGRLKPRGDTMSGIIAIGNTRAAPFAVAAFMGAKKATGWYRRPRYSPWGSKQFSPWVGNQWDPGWDGKAGRPYGVGEAMRATWPKVEQQYENRWAEAFERGS